jgi:hypothetical protein
MANRDIAGLLTGIPTQGISVDPMAMMTPDQQRMQMGAQAAKRMKGGIRGMFRGGKPSAQEQIGAAVSQLDLTTPDGLTTLAKLQQVQGDLKGAAQTLGQAKELTQKTELRTSLLRIAEAQGNTEMIEFLENNGDLSVAQSVLFRAGRAPKTSSLTSAEVDEYDLYLEDYTEKELLAVGAREEGKLYGTNVDPKGVKKLMLQAEYIYTAGKAATREDALRMVILGGAPDETLTPTPTEGGGTSKDPFANIRG